jgi:MinD-like ATPase involved in chromosome partitioning or flagellar assembly
MTLLAVLSAKASPGATTTALLLASALGTDAMLVEADGSGGSLGARFGLGDEPGLRTLAVRARRGLDLASVVEHTQCLGAVSTLVGPASAEEADAVLSTVAVDLAAVLRDCSQLVVVDVGRARPGSPSWPLVQRASRCLVVCRPRLEEYRPAAALSAELVAVGPRVALICVGSAPYPPAEFAAETGVELAGVLPDDPRGAAALRGEPSTARGLRRSSLWMAGANLAKELARTSSADVPA